MLSQMHPGILKDKVASPAGVRLQAGTPMHLGVWPAPVLLPPGRRRHPRPAAPAMQAPRSPG